MDETNGLYPYAGDAYYPVEGVDGKVGDFLTKHKKKILVGAGVLAIGLGAVLYVKHSKDKKKARTSSSRGLSGTGRKKKSSKKRRTTKRKSSKRVVHLK